MNSKPIAFIIFAVACYSCSQPAKSVFDPAAEANAIRAVLQAQQIAWNNGDLEGFMRGYWNSDSLQFMSPRGMNHGWKETLEGYQKGYPDRAAMGNLSFEILQITPLSSLNFVVMGKYHVVRNSNNLDGVFTLIFRKVDGKWVAVYDHTS